MRYLLLAVLCCISGVAHGIPLDSWTDWSVDQPYVSKQVPPGAMIVRGSGTDAYYVLEADPTTGELPVSLSGASISIDYSGVTGAAVPADAAYIGGNDAGTLRGVHVDSSGDLQVDVLSSSLPSGAATETTLSAINTKTPALGQALMAASTPVVIASNQSAIPVSQSGTWTVVTSSFPTTADTNYGTPGASTVRTAAMLGVGSTAVSNANPVPISDAGGIITVDGTVAVSNLPTTVDTNAGANTASTLRVTDGSRTYSDSVNNVYSSVNVTTGAWVQLIASTAAAINLLCVTDTGGQVMELGVGGAGVESRILLVATGWSACVPIRIAASARLAVRAVTATANTGNLTITGMN